MRTEAYDYTENMEKGCNQLSGRVVTLWREGEKDTGGVVGESLLVLKMTRNTQDSLLDWNSAKYS